jgi:ferredoxin
MTLESCWGSECWLCLCAPFFSPFPPSDAYVPAYSRGSFGHVYLGRDKQTGETVAIKIMDRAKIKAASIEREWTVLSHLGTHAHVVGFKCAYVTPANVCFVMEVCVRCDICVAVCSHVFTPCACEQHAGWRAI